MCDGVEMNNKEFISTLQLCGRLEDLPKHYIKVLVDCDINLLDYYKDIMRYIHTNNTGFSDEMIVLKTFGDVLMYYKRKDRTKLECFEEFVDLMKLKLKVFSDENIVNNIMGCGKTLGSAHLLRDLRLFRIKEIQKDSLICLNDKLIRCSTSFNNNGTVTFILDGMQTRIGGILIINGKERYIEVNNARDEGKMLKSLMKIDFDLAMIPSSNFLYKHPYGVCDISGLHNMEYLEYLELVLPDNPKLNVVKKECYERVADYDVDLKDMLGLALEVNAVRLHMIVNLISAVIEKLGSLDKDTRASYIKEVYKVLDAKNKMIKPSNIQWYGTERINIISDMFRNKNLSLEECMDKLKIEKCENVAKLVNYKVPRNEQYSIDKENRLFFVKDGDVCTIDKFCMIVDREHKIKVIDKLKEKSLYEKLKGQKDYLIIMEN